MYLMETETELSTIESTNSANYNLKRTNLKSTHSSNKSSTTKQNDTSKYHYNSQKFSKWFKLLVGVSPEYDWHSISDTSTHSISTQPPIIITSKTTPTNVTANSEIRTSNQKDSCKNTMPTITIKENNMQQTDLNKLNQLQILIENSLNQLTQN